MKHEMPVALATPEKLKEKTFVVNPEAREPLWVNLVEGQLAGVEDEKRREGLEQVIEGVKKKSLEYMQLVIRLSRHSEKMRVDPERHKAHVEAIDQMRRIKHNALISDIDIIARNYGQEELDVSWRSQFRSREALGEWALQIATHELASRYPKPERELSLDSIAKDRNISGSVTSEALDAASFMIDAHLRPEDPGCERDATLAIEHYKKYWPELKLSESETRDLILQVTSRNIYGH
ncbi:MAG: DUF3232 domain-containing protein [Candidatus Niyogibacteria bacterium]|nr:DUF3232 domain-containing protein [Candidatus Niyogibacteria bacterium]